MLSGTVMKYIIWDCSIISGSVFGWQMSSEVENRKFDIGLFAMDNDDDGGNFDNRYT